MSIINYDLIELYERTFGGKPYKIPESDQSGKPGKNQVSAAGYKLVDMYQEREIWLPTRLAELNMVTNKRSEFLLPFCAVKISGKKTIVKTPMAERQGTVKELYSIDDYSISLKGFFIDIQRRIWPEDQLLALKEIFETNTAIAIDNALVNIVLGIDTRFVMVSYELPEVEGGRKHVRPFNIQLESDSIFTLEV